MTYYRLLLILALFIVLSVHGAAQSDARYEDRYRLAETVLNVILNSPAFDSIYASDTVCFYANDLVREGTSLVLLKNGVGAQVLPGEELEEKEYVCLADFTTNWDHPIRARVQLSLRKLLFNVMMEKEGEEWVMASYMVMDDDDD